ncbi:MAG: hypothetical protein H8F28_22220 [Fibrella sp.]|nr:hypothetical protein [Armatimonadota bacterium]
MNEFPSQNSWSKPPVPAPIVPQPVPAPSPQRPSFSKATKVVFAVLGSFAAVFVVILAVYIGALATSPQVVAPVRPPAPKKNGFDLLKAATDKPFRKDDVADAIATSPKKKWTPDQKRKLIAGNRVAILATRQALAVPYLEENRSNSLNDEFVYYAKFRHMARVLVLAGNVAFEEGKQKEAADYYLDALTIGRRVPNRTFLIGRLVGIACEAISRRAIWNHLERMDTDTALHCLTRLQALQAEHIPYHVTLEEEKYTVLNIAVEGMKDPNSIITGSGKDDELTEDDRKARKAFGIYRNVVPRKYVTDTLGAHMDKIIAQSKEPYIKGNDELPEPKELYSRLVVPPVQKARLRYVYSETGDALLRTALALRIHKARTGKYPTNLSELVVAKLLPGIPDDPFDFPGAPLHYQVLPTGKYLLYSIGPDGTDDNGKGIEVKSPKGKPDRNVVLDSKGDMVAGWYGY